MCTSVIDKRRNTAFRNAMGNLGGAMFAVFFGAVYEHFSFGVYSNFMIYAFAPLLIVGFILALLSRTDRPPHRLTLNLINSASATLSVGMAATGIVEIYGTENKYLRIYFIVGALLSLLSVISYFIGTPSANGDIQAHTKA